MTVPAQDSYALGIADASYRWYVIASKRSRRAHRSADVGAVLISASIPVVAVIAPGLPAITAVLGAVLVVIAGVRAIYLWSENYLPLQPSTRGGGGAAPAVPRVGGPVRRSSHP